MGLALVLLTIIGIYVFDVYRNIDSTTDKIYEPVDEEVEQVRSSSADLNSKEPISILLLGVDTGDLGRTERGRSDTMMVVTVNPNTKKSTITSIPRDTYTEIVGYGTSDKINHAYAFGGNSMAINSVQNLLDIPIDYYVTVNMAGIQEIVNAVGGVDVVSPLTFSQDGYTFYQGEVNHLDDYERMRSDPDALAAYDKLLRLPKGERPNLSTLPARYGALVIYNNYPEGKSTIHDAVFMDYYIFEDDNLPQQWTIISDSVKTILGYTCQKATCSYRGRNYEAWYNPDLPVNAGPWKFSGLPGLIMSVQDTKGHYTFEIKGLMKVKEPIEYIEYSNRKYSHSDRKTFLKTNAKSLQIGIVRYLEANAPKGSSSSDFKQTGGGAKYDLLERDY